MGLGAHVWPAIEGGAAFPPPKTLAAPCTPSLAPHLPLAAAPCTPLAPPLPGTSSLAPHLPVQQPLPSGEVFPCRQLKPGCCCPLGGRKIRSTEGVGGSKKKGSRPGDCGDRQPAACSLRSGKGIPLPLPLGRFPDVLLSNVSSSVFCSSIERRGWLG